MRTQLSSKLAVRFGLEMLDDIIALHVSTEKKDNKRLRAFRAEKVEKPARSTKSAVPRLEIIHSPYRRIYEPILDFVRKTEKETRIASSRWSPPNWSKLIGMNKCFTTCMAWA